MTLEQTKEEIAKLQKKLDTLQEEKHQLFLQLKRVLNEEDKRKARMREQRYIDMAAMGHHIYQSGMHLAGAHMVMPGVPVQTRTPLPVEHPKAAIYQTHTPPSTSHGGALKRQRSPSPPVVQVYPPRPTPHGQHPYGVKHHTTYAHDQSHHSYPVSQPSHYPSSQSGQPAYAASQSQQAAAYATSQSQTAYQVSQTPHSQYATSQAATGAYAVTQAASKYAHGQAAYTYQYAQHKPEQYGQAYRVQQPGDVKAYLLATTVSSAVLGYMPPQHGTPSQQAAYAEQQTHLRGMAPPQAVHPQQSQQALMPHPPQQQLHVPPQHKASLVSSAYPPRPQTRPGSPAAYQHATAFQQGATRHPPPHGTYLQQTRPGYYQ
ncbi:G protein pathway suppressor 2-like isoform X4 [Branchiostoma lanceolatum]